MNEGIIKDAYELIIQKIQTIISVLYLLMIGIGMLFNHYKYQAFGINIFDFADIFDFLIAPFRDSKIIIASILALVIPSLTYFVDISVNKKFPDWYTKANFGWNKKAWYNKFRYFSFLFLYLFLLFEVASGYGHHLRHSIYKKKMTSLSYLQTRRLRKER